VAFSTLCFLLEGVTEVELDLVGREYERTFDAMTSCQSSLTRYGSVALILLAENCSWAVVDVFALVSALAKENGGRLPGSVG
jgi:hypothetical protein